MERLDDDQPSASPALRGRRVIRTGIRRAFQLALRRRDHWQNEVEEEIRLHLTLRAEQLIGAGTSPEDAYAEAGRRFGPLDESRARLLHAAHHRERRMERAEFVDDLRQDVAFAFRTLGRQKAWTAITILTLALGIGATTAVFSVVSTLLLHAVQYPHADRIVYVYQQPSGGGAGRAGVTLAPAAPAIRTWRDGSRSFEDLQPARIRTRSLKTTSGEPSVVNTAAVLPSFPEFAGERVILGRMFTTQDIQGGARVVMLGETFWRERLGASTKVLGNALTIGGSMYVVTGVMPSALRFGSADGRATDAWLPLDLRDKGVDGGERAVAPLIGRLRPGVSIDAAQAELDSLYARSAGISGGKSSLRTVISTPAERVRFRASLQLLMGAVGLVLLVACANVAHLLQARTASRRREIAIRTALGARRSRILRQLLTESFVLSSAGLAAGVLMGWLGLRALIALRPASHDELRVAHLDSTTLILAISVCFVSAVVFGIVGAFQSARHSTNDSLKHSAPSSAAGQKHGRGRAILVVSETALSAVLVVGAVLVVRSLQHLYATDLGFDPRQLYTIYPTLGPRLQEPAAKTQFMQEFVARVRTIPGIRSAILVSTGPGSRSFNIGTLEIDGETPPANARAFIDVNRVNAAYFPAMGIKFVDGAVFADTTAESREVLVNKAFARKHWPAHQAIGHRIRVAQKADDPWFTIVGVVDDALTGGPMTETTAPLLYYPLRRDDPEALIVRTSGDARSLTSITQIGRELGARLVTIDGVEAFMNRSVSEPRFVMLVMTVFSALGLILATVGLYGVMAYTVAQETREIGIRIALGATRFDVGQRVLVRGASLAICGTIVGLGVATWTTRLIESQLYGVRRLDPSSFAIGAATLVGGALLACILPTRRALAVDPMTAIRAD